MSSAKNKFSSELEDVEKGSDCCGNAKWQLFNRCFANNEDDGDGEKGVSLVDRE